MSQVVHLFELQEVRSGVTDPLFGLLGGLVVPLSLAVLRRGEWG